MIIVATAFDRWFGTSEYLFDLFAGNVDWSESHLTQIIGTGLLIIGFMLYIKGLLAIPQWTRVRTWTRAMRGEEIDQPRPNSALESEASIPKTQRWRRNRARLKNGRDKVKWFDGPRNF